MKIGKQSLLDSIDAALERNEKERAVWDSAVKEWRKREEQKWLAEQLPKWLGLRNMITKASKASKPITVEMVQQHLRNQRGYGSSYLSDWTFTPDASPSSPIVLDGTRVDRPRGIPVGDLKALKTFLEGSPDESFSMEALSRLGFKAPAFVFRAAVSE